MNPNTMKKVLMIIPSYPPVSGSSMFRNFKFTKYLLEFGYMPCVLSMTEKRARKIDYGLLKKVPDQIQVYRTPVLDPISKIANLISSIRKFLSIEPSKEKSNSDIIRSVPPPTGAENKTKKGRNFLDFILWLFWFPEESSGWILPGFIKGLRVVKKEKPQILFSSSPPISAHVIGLLLKKCTRLRWVIDLRDPWIMGDHPSLQYKIIRNLHSWLEKIVFRNADSIIFNTEYMRSMYCDRHGTKLIHKAYVITNGVDLEDFQNIGKEKKGGHVDGPLTIVHTGEFFRPGRLPDSLLKAIGELREENIISNGDIRILFMGGREYQTWPNCHHIFNQYKIGPIVNFTEHVPHNQVIETLASSDVLLLLQTHKRFATQIPAKVFEYVMVGKPILAIVTEGATKQLLEELLNREGNYWICKPEVGEIKKCIMNCLSIKREKGFHISQPSKHVIERISRKNQTRRLAKLFKSLEK